jgi:hypothetical protein
LANGREDNGIAIALMMEHPRVSRRQSAFGQGSCGDTKAVNNGMRTLIVCFKHQAREPIKPRVECSLSLSFRSASSFHSPGLRSDMVDGNRNLSVGSIPSFERTLVGPEKTTFVNQTKPIPQFAGTIELSGANAS